MAKRLLVWAAPLVFIGVLFYQPVIRLVALGLDGDWLSTLGRGELLAAIWFTVWSSLVSTSFCLLLGLVGAYVLYRKQFVGQRFVRNLITVPFVLPTMVVAIGFSVFQNWNTFLPPVAWVIIAQVFMNYGLVVRTIGSLWLRLDPETEEAAWTSGAGRLITTLRISIPQLRPAILASASLVFLYCSASYGLVLVLGGGVNSIETSIAEAALRYLDLPTAATLALAQTLLTAVVFIASARLSANTTMLDSVGDPERQSTLDARDWPAIAVTALVVTGLILPPIFAVLWRALNVGDVEGGLFANFANLAGRGARDLLNIDVGGAALNSLRNLTVATAIALVVGVLVSHLLIATKLRWRNALDLAFLMPVGISSVVLGLGLLITFGDGPLPLRDSWLVVPIAQSVLAIPLVIRLVYPALATLDREPLEAAELDGAGRWRRWLSIETPLLRQTLITAAGFTAIISLGEFGTASLLTYGGQSTIPTVLYQLISRPGPQNYGMAMAVSAILMAVTFAAVVLFGSSFAKTRRRP